MIIGRSSMVASEKRCTHGDGVYPERNKAAQMSHLSQNAIREVSWINNLYSFV